MSVFVMVCETRPLPVYPIVFRHPGLPVGGKRRVFHFIHRHVRPFLLVSLIWQPARASSLRRRGWWKKPSPIFWIWTAIPSSTAGCQSYIQHLKLVKQLTPAHSHKKHRCSVGLAVVIYAITGPHSETTSPSLHLRFNRTNFHNRVDWSSIFTKNCIWISFCLSEGRISNFGKQYFSFEAGFPHKTVFMVSCQPNQFCVHLSF